MFPLAPIWLERNARYPSRDCRSVTDRAWMSVEAGVIQRRRVRLLQQLP
jgi:hypothetical protein